MVALAAIRTAGTRAWRLVVDDGTTTDTAAATDPSGAWTGAATDDEPSVISSRDRQNPSVRIAASPRRRTSGSVMVPDASRARPEATTRSTTA